jgi:hypothetical protein
MKLYISEFDKCVIDARGQPVAAPEYPTVAPDQVVAITAGSLQSATFSTRTRFIQYHPDSVCSIVIDVNPEATVDNARVGSTETRFVGVAQGLKIAVIANV